MADRKIHSDLPVTDSGLNLEMYHYTVFGGSLRTDIEFPELSEAPTCPVPSWTLCRSSDASAVEGGELLGVVPERLCRAELWRMGQSGYRFHHSCSGQFLLSLDGSAVRYALTDSASQDTVRGDVLGRVLAVAMHLRGVLSLHASAVTLGDGAIAFVGSKGYGKSTLSLALARSGARLVTDDILPVMPTEPLTVAPGVQSMRLRRDSAECLLVPGTASREGVDGKRIVDMVPGIELELAHVPLAAVYSLSPMASEVRGPAASREQMSHRRSAIELVRHAKVGLLLGGPEAAVVLELASEVARAVPVFTLQVGRSLERLAEVVATIRSWHTCASQRASV